jgi:putative ABC transport system substrate-binding protein
MKRREFITGLAGTTAWPVAAWAQAPPKIWRIGILHSGFPNRTPIHLLFWNFTGLSFSDAVLGGKRLELLLDTLPDLQRVAVIWSRSFVGNSAILNAIREAARARNVEVFPRELQDADDLSSAFDNAKASGAQAAIFMTDNVMFGRRKEVAALALARHLPSIHSFAPEVEDGGLMSFGPELDESYRRTAALVDAILKGALPANLPVEEPTRFTIAVNLKTAAALGIIFPPAILVRADEVIE